MTNISQKDDKALQQLYDAGVRNLYLGIESGLDDVLAFMKKDHTIAQAYEQIARMQAAGMIFDAHMMTGVAGKGRGLENAEAIAEFFNRTHPHKVINFSIFHQKRAPLYKNIEAGRYVPADEQENLLEERRFIQCIEVPDMVYDGFHDVIEQRFRGTFPKDKQRLLQQVEKAIAYVKSFGYINDERYVRNYIECRCQSKSRRQLEQELQFRKGVSPELIQQVYEELEPVDQCELIRKHLEKKHYRNAEADDRQKRSVIASLARKGFCTSDIISVMKETD